jgi:predicted CoA-binding protein
MAVSRSSFFRSRVPIRYPLAVVVQERCNRMNKREDIAYMLGITTECQPTAPRTLAVVGLSGDPAKPSHSVSAYMQLHGYRILPINPALDEVLGERTYGSLSDLVQAGIRPDVVNVFRLPKFIPSIVEEMITVGLNDLWVQLGIMNRDAADRAEQAGMRVVMDRCILIEHSRLTR